MSVSVVELVQPQDHLSASLRNGPVRFPLRLLHGGEHDVPAQVRGVISRRGGPRLHRLHASRRAQATPHRRRTARTPEYHEPLPVTRAAPQTGALDELTLTTNGSQLARYAEELKAAGVRRINVSLDTLDPEKFAAITRWGRLDRVLEGINTAKRAGLQIKLNVVALKGVNDESSMI